MIYYVNQCFPGLYADPEQQEQYHCRTLCFVIKKTKRSERMANLMKHYEFTPDYHNVVLAAQNKAAPRIPLYEHLIGARMMTELLG